MLAVQVTLTPEGDLSLTWAPCDEYLSRYMRRHSVRGRGCLRYIGINALKACFKTARPSSLWAGSAAPTGKLRETKYFVLPLRAEYHPGLC